MKVPIACSPRVRDSHLVPFYAFYIAHGLPSKRPSDRRTSPTPSDRRTSLALPGLVLGVGSPGAAATLRKPQTTALAQALQSACCKHRLRLDCSCCLSRSFSRSLCSAWPAPASIILLLVYFSRCFDQTTLLCAGEGGVCHTRLDPQTPKEPSPSLSSQWSAILSYLSFSCFKSTSPTTLCPPRL